MQPGSPAIEIKWGHTVTGDHGVMKKRVLFSMIRDLDLCFNLRPRGVPSKDKTLAQRWFTVGQRRRLWSNVLCLLVPISIAGERACNTFSRHSLKR